MYRPWDHFGCLVRKTNRGLTNQVLGLWGFTDFVLFRDFLDLPDLFDFPDILDSHDFWQVTNYKWEMMHDKW